MNIKNFIKKIIYNILIFLYIITFFQKQYNNTDYINIKKYIEQYLLFKTKLLLMNNNTIKKTISEKKYSSNIDRNIDRSRYKDALDLISKERYKDALFILNKLLLHDNFFYKKKLYKEVMFKTAICYIKLKNYDLAVMILKNLLKGNKEYHDKDHLAEAFFFNLGMCYYLQSNDYFFSQENRYIFIKIFLFFKKHYPNSKYSQKVDKMLYKAFFTLKKKQASIGMYYFNKKKYKSSLIIFKQIIKYFKENFNIQEYYIYMIISQYKVEEENENFSFEETNKLYNMYLQSFFKDENQFKYEMNLILPLKIKKLFKKVENHLMIIKNIKKNIKKYLLNNNEYKNI